VEQAGKHPEVNRPGEGHLHFMLDLEPLVVWERPEPYTFTDVPPGEHQLMVEVVENDHSSLAPPVIRAIHFRTAAAARDQGPSPAPAPESGALPRGGEGPPLPPGLALLGLALLAGGTMLRHRRTARRAPPEPATDPIRSAGRIDAGWFRRGRQARAEGYCVKCRARRLIRRGQLVTLKHGRPAVAGVCPACGTKVWRFGRR